jgi:L-fucose mutarotase
MIADGNYPFSTAMNPHAQIVYLNLTPGIPTVLDVLRVLLDTIPVEAAEAMKPLDEHEPEVYRQYRALLPKEVEMRILDRFAYYDAARSREVALVIATGDPNLAVNIMLTIGVIPPAR